MTRGSLRLEAAGLLVALAGLALFLGVVDAVERFDEEDELTVLDARVAAWMRAHAPDAAVSAGLLLANLGGGFVVALLVAAAAVHLALHGRKGEALAVTLGALVLQALVALLKWLFARPRPEAGVVAAGGLSFPSGHAAFGAYVAVVLAWLVLRHVRRPRWGVVLLAAAGAWALLQAAGRVVIGVHYVSDALAGLGLGLAAGGSVLAAWPLGRRLAAVAAWLRATRRRQAR